MYFVASQFVTYMRGGRRVDFKDFVKLELNTQSKLKWQHTMANIMRALNKALDSTKNWTNNAFRVSGNNGLYIALGILAVVLLIIIIPSAVAAHASNALVTTQILNGDKIYLTYNGKYLSVSSSNAWVLTDTPRVLQIELQDEKDVTYATGVPILTKMYFKLKDVTTGTYATVASATGTVACTYSSYSWTSTPGRFFLGGTDTNSLDSVENVAMMSGDSFALKAIDGVCGEGYSIYHTGSKFTISDTNKLWKVSKVA